MADVSVTYSFSANTTAASGEVNQNFTDLVNYLNARADGGTAWDGAYVESASVNPVLRVNNSSGTNNIAEFEDNGTNVVVIPDGGGITLVGAPPASPISNTVYRDNIIKGWAQLNCSTATLNDSFNRSEER